MILGPERLPQAGRQVGKMVADFRRATAGVRKEIEDSMSVEDLRREVTELRSAFDLRSLMAEGDKPVSSTSNSAVAAPDGDAPVIAPRSAATAVVAPPTTPIRDILDDVATNPTPRPMTSSDATDESTF
jgi:Sec-independent protein translocase protein TatA